MTSIPEISARGSLILWGKCLIPDGPRSGREGEKCRPLDHMRHIPFIHQLCSHPTLSIPFNIYTKLLQIFLACGVYIMSWNIVHLSFPHALVQNDLFQGSVPFWSHFVLYVVCISARYSEAMPLTLDTDATQHCVIVVAHCRSLYCCSFLVLATMVWRNNSANNHKGSQLVFSCLQTTTTTNKQTTPENLFCDN